MPMLPRGRKQPWVQLGALSGGEGDFLVWGALSNPVSEKGTSGQAKSSGTLGSGTVAADHTFP